MKFKNPMGIAVGVAILFAMTTICAAAPAKRQRPVGIDGDHPLSLGVTHIVPNAFVPPAGSLVIGTAASFGLFDFMEVSSNLYLDFQQVYNAGVKFSLLHDYDLAMAVFLNYSTQTIQAYVPPLPNTVTFYESASAFTPGAVLSYRVSSQMVGHLGFSFPIRTPSIGKGEAPKSGYLQGASLNPEFAFGLTNSTSIAVGASYDTSFDYWGAGASFHIKNLHIGAHYYFGVTSGSFLPILSGAYVAQL